MPAAAQAELLTVASSAIANVSGEFELLPVCTQDQTFNVEVRCGRLFLRPYLP